MHPSIESSLTLANSVVALAEQIQAATGAEHRNMNELAELSTALEQRLQELTCALAAEQAEHSLKQKAV